MDALSSLYIPPHLVTQEFFQLLLNDKLNPDGFVVINVGRSSGDRTLVEAIVRNHGSNVSDFCDGPSQLVEYNRLCGKNPLASWENLNQT